MDTRPGPSARAWTPPAGIDHTLHPAGAAWDAVKMPAYLGEAVIARLGAQAGGVICDPSAQRHYLLIAPNSAGSWAFAEYTCVRILGSGSHLAVPPQGRTQGPGPHWLRTATPEGRWLTGTRPLHTALHAALGEARPRTAP